MLLSFNLVYIGS